VAYLDAETAARTPKDAVLVEGAPVLAVEVLSPSDKQQDIWAKVQDYLASGTKWVWVLGPAFETITAHRPDGPPVMLSDQELTAEPHLPGFKCKVAELFA
jgi:Uma2 family endonuclease